MDPKGRRLGNLFPQRTGKTADKAADFRGQSKQFRPHALIDVSKPLGDENLRFDFLQRTTGNRQEVQEITSRVSPLDAKPLEDIKAMDKPEGWLTDYSTSNFNFRVNISARYCVNTYFMGEAVPAVGPHLAPNCLALYLGCHGVEMPDTVW